MKPKMNQKIQKKDNSIDTPQSEPIKYGKYEKLKGSIILLISLTFIHGSFVPFFFCLYLSINYQIYWLFTVLVLLLSYQFSPFCKRSERFLKFIQVKEQYKYFKDWSCTFEEPMKDNKCMLASHPHGVLDFGFIMNGPVFYPNTAICGSRVILSIPINGIFLRWCGVVSVDPQNVKKMLKKGENLGLLPGGFEEATLTSRQENRIFLKNRKGFLKYAVQYGYDIYPSFTFNENKLYTVFEPLLNFRLALNKFKLPGVIAFSNMGLYPSNQQALHTVVGKPLKFQQSDNPSKQQINEYHAIYVENLKQLYYNNREKYGVNTELVLY